MYAYLWKFLLNIKSISREGLDKQIMLPYPYMNIYIAKSVLKKCTDFIIK